MSALYHTTSEPPLQLKWTSNDNSLAWLLIGLITYNLERGQKTNLRRSVTKEKRGRWWLSTVKRLSNVMVHTCRWASSPAQRPEPGQIIGVVNAVANGDDFMEALDLNTEDLNKEEHQRAPVNLFELFQWHTERFFKGDRSLYQIRAAASRKRKKLEAHAFNKSK